MTIYSLNVLLFLFETSLLFHVKFCCFLTCIYDYTVEVRNRSKGLDLIDRVPDELWNEVRDIVQETGIKTMEKKCKKAKRMDYHRISNIVPCAIQ